MNNIIDKLDFELKHQAKPNCAVLLIHGMTGSPYELKKYGQYIHLQGYDVFAYSLPGHGNNVIDINNVTYNDWIDSTFNDFKRLKAEYNKVFLSGLCLGAVLCLAVAESYPEKTDGIVALSTTLFLDGWRMPWYRFLMPLGLGTIVRFYYTYPECEPYGIKNLKTRHIVQKLLGKSNVGMDNFPMSCIYELLKLSKVVRCNLGKVICPILIIHSYEDDLTSIRSAELVYKKVASKSKKLMILNDSYHMVLYDNQKDIVFESVRDFLTINAKNKLLNSKNGALLC